MAKPISFTKRDLEKKKQEKRLAKQQKKEERYPCGQVTDRSRVII